MIGNIQPRIIIKSKYSWIVLSLIVHLIFLNIHKGPDPRFNQFEQEESKKISFKILKSKQIVENHKANNEKNDSHLLSEKNNRVLRQTVARNNLVRKKKTQPQQKLFKEKQKQKSKIKEKKTNAISDLSALKITPDIEMVKKSQQVTPSADSASNSDHVKDIKLGDLNSLNTQEYKYYGYYFRIKQRLEQFWGHSIREAADKIMRQGRSIASNSNISTGLIVHLDTRGSIIKIELSSKSGVRELDQAAVKAFNKAGPFPNPPKGILKNGRAIIRWGFVVNT